MANGKKKRGSRNAGNAKSPRIPPRSQGIPRSFAEKVDALDDHLYLLRVNLEDHFAGETAHLRVIAAELRVLVCFSSNTDGLIWRLAKELGVSDTVGLDLPPRVDQLADHVSLSFIPLQLSSDRPAPTLDFLVRDDYSLEEVVKKRAAVYPNGKAMTYDEVIKHSSQQIGTAHESDNVDPNLHMIRQFLISNQGIHDSILCSIARLALIVGDRVLNKATEDRGYQVKPRLRGGKSLNQP